MRLVFLALHLRQPLATGRLLFRHQIRSPLVVGRPQFWHQLRSPLAVRQRWYHHQTLVMRIYHYQPPLPLCRCYLHWHRYW